MSSVITIHYEHNVQHVESVESLSTKIQEELYLANKISEEIIEEISKIRELTRRESGVLIKALTEAEESSKALQPMIPSLPTTNVDE